MVDIFLGCCCLRHDDALVTLSIFDKRSEGETTQISCSSLQHLMVYDFRLEMALVLSMKDRDSIISRMRIIVYLVSGTAQVIASVSLVLDGFRYIVFFFFFFLACHATRKSLEAISFYDSIRLFSLRLPFDVGERCLIDGVELVVKKINFSSTTFVGLDNTEYQFSTIARFEGNPRLDKIQLILSEFQGTTIV